MPDCYADALVRYASESRRPGQPPGSYPSVDIRPPAVARPVTPPPAAPRHVEWSDVEHLPPWAAGLPPARKPGGATLHTTLTGGPAEPSGVASGLRSVYDSALGMADRLGGAINRLPGRLADAARRIPGMVADATFGPPPKVEPVEDALTEPIYEEWRKPVVASPYRPPVAPPVPAYPTAERAPRRPAGDIPTPVPTEETPLDRPARGLPPALKELMDRVDSPPPPGYEREAWAQRLSEELRRWQGRHPDEVTDALNRLASHLTESGRTPVTRYNPLLDEAFDPKRMARRGRQESYADCLADFTSASRPPAV